MRITLSSAERHTSEREARGRGWRTKSERRNRYNDKKTRVAICWRMARMTFDTHYLQEQS